MNDNTDANRRPKSAPSSVVLESKKRPEGVDDVKKKLEQRVAYLSSELEEERKRADERIVDLMCKVAQYEDSSKKAVELEQKLAQYEGVQQQHQQPLIQKQQNLSGDYIFLGADTVAESIAEELGVSKEDLFIHPSRVIWVKAEKTLDNTRIVRETREFLMSNGVRQDAFSRPATKKSDRVILVKNLSLGIQKKELRKIFMKFGYLGKVLIPPEGAISALVAFRRSEDAKEAFTKLHAELHLRDHPLYLEWAPEDVFEEEGEEVEGEEVPVVKCDFVDPSKKKRKRGAEMTEEEKKKKINERIIHDQNEEQGKNKMLEKVKDEVMEDKEEDVEKTLEGRKEHTMDKKRGKKRRRTEPNAVVWVYNLSTETDKDSLDKFFRQRFDIVHAKVAGEFGGSTGFIDPGTGFVRFWTQEESLKAIEIMQGTKLDGHSIELSKKKKNMKTVYDEPMFLNVKRVPLKASPSEVESIFSGFSGFKSLHMPKNADGSHRGFGFVDFNTKNDMKLAYNSFERPIIFFGKSIAIECGRSSTKKVEIERRLLVDSLRGVNAS